MSYLDGIFPKSQFDTAGYVIGKVNGDHWCLYLATPLALNSDGIPLTNREVDEISDDVKDELTLEILMHDLDPTAMKSFWRTKEEEQQGKLPHNLNVRKQQFLNPRRLYVNYFFNIRTKLGLVIYIPNLSLTITFLILVVIPPMVCLGLTTTPSMSHLKLIVLMLHLRLLFLLRVFPLQLVMPTSIK